MKVSLKQKYYLEKVFKAIITIPIAVYSLISVYLLLNVFITGFKSPGEFMVNPIGIPRKWDFSNYVTAWEMAKFSIYFKNSIIITAFSLVTITIIASMAAYGIARYKYKFSNTAYMYFLMGIMFPLQLYILPLFLVERNFGLLNSHLGLIITYTATAQSFSIFLLTGFFRTLPKELEEAARLDGAGDYRIFLQIMLPLCKPIIVTVLILNLIGIWNDFFLPLVFIQKAVLRTIPLGFMVFTGSNPSNYSLIFAATAISIIPIVIAYMFSSKVFIKGLVSGAIK